jgi:DNA adenine methylase
MALRYDPTAEIMKAPGNEPGAFSLAGVTPMVATSSKLRSPLKWHGGKSYLARRIIALVPPARAFAEHYAGGMSVGLNLGPVPWHLANDLDPELMGFWRSLQNRNRCEFLEAIRDQPYSEAAFRRAVDHCRRPGDALAFLVRNRMSRGGLGRSFAWSERTRGGRPGDLNAWETFKAELPAIVARLAPIRLTCRDALESIRAVDDAHGPDVVHYCDPPYLPSTRSRPRAYSREMTVEQHQAMLATLRGVRGAVLLSGYRSELYDRELAGWHRAEFDMPNHSGQGRAKQRRVECVWSNRPCPA